MSQDTPGRPEDEDLPETEDTQPDGPQDDEADDLEDSEFTPPEYDEGEDDPEDDSPGTVPPDGDEKG